MTFPVLSGGAQKSVCRNLDHFANTIDLAIASVALPSIAVAIRVGICGKVRGWGGGNRPDGPDEQIEQPPM